MRMRYLLSVVVGLMISPVTSFAQNDQTLADVRQELNMLFVEVQKLRRELSTTGGAAVSSGGTSVLDLSLIHI